MYLKIFVSFILLASLLSCSNNTLDDVAAEQEETPDFTTYQDIKSVIDNNCLQCHSNPPQNGAPMPLVSFENVRDAVISRGLLDRISRNEGESGLMPKGGPRLPQATINSIFEWEEDGLLEN